MSKLLFSCGTNFEIWTAYNCERCWKGGIFRESKRSDCKIATDIVGQFIDGTDYTPRDDSYRAVEHMRCFQFEDTRPKPKTHRPLQRQLTIDFDI